jgi:hypothetical protein
MLRLTPVANDKMRSAKRLNVEINHVLRGNVAEPGHRRNPYCWEKVEIVSIQTSGYVV